MQKYIHFQVALDILEFYSWYQHNGIAIPLELTNDSVFVENKSLNIYLLVYDL